jgi:hypothetical protein
MPCFNNNGDPNDKHVAACFNHDSCTFKRRCSAVGLSTDYELDDLSQRGEEFSFLAVQIGSWVHLAPLFKVPGGTRR